MNSTVAMIAINALWWQWAMTAPAVQAYYLSPFWTRYPDGK